MIKKNPNPSPEKGRRAAGDALLRIFRDVLAEARAMETGILADRDPEFLHDYRVGLRKLRSMTGRIPGVFPKAVSAKWEKTLRDSCRATNTLRDLDVFLLEKKTLAKSLPASLRGGLKPFFREIRRCRDIAARGVRRRLKSRNYRLEFARIERAWGGPQAIRGNSRSVSPPGGIAMECLHRHFRKIRRIQKSVDGSTPDAVLHGIRVECKRMRHILEFFGDFFCADAVKPVVENLKKLQARLGRYNDTAVQVEFLLKYSETHLAKTDVRQGLAIGGLIGGLHREHFQLRKKVLKALRTFCRDGVGIILEPVKTKSVSRQHAREGLGLSPRRKPDPPGRALARRFIGNRRPAGGSGGRRG